MLESIAERVAHLNTVLNNHIKMTDRNLGQICDKIKGFKNQIVCSNDRRASHIDELSTSSNELKVIVGTKYDTLTRRLQKITDLVKNMPARSQGPTINIELESTRLEGTESGVTDTVRMEITFLVGD